MLTLFVNTESQKRRIKLSPEGQIWGRISRLVYISGPRRHPRRIARNRLGKIFTDSSSIIPRQSRTVSKNWHSKMSRKTTAATSFSYLKSSHSLISISSSALLAELPILFLTKLPHVHRSLQSTGRAGLVSDSDQNPSRSLDRI